MHEKTLGFPKVSLNSNRVRTEWVSVTGWGLSGWASCQAFDLLYAQDWPVLAVDVYTGAAHPRHVWDSDFVFHKLSCHCLVPCTVPPVY